MASPHHRLATRLAHDPTILYQQSRRARVAIDFSMGCARVSHASGVLGVCVVVILFYGCTEAQRTGTS
jgi:hypothetical protein